MMITAQPFRSSVNSAADAFVTNRSDHLALINEMRQILERARTLSEAARPRFERRGQLLPRERLERLLDPGAPFLEIGNMAGYLVDDPNPETSVPGATQICGIGYVSGTRCMVQVDDSGINAGAMTRTSTRKGLRCHGHRPAAEAAVRPPRRECRCQPARVRGGDVDGAAASSRAWRACRRRVCRW
jgi:geranyl-CoA carboxylase beta subunit